MSLAQTLTTIQSQLATAKSQLKEQARAHTKELTQREVSVRQVAEEAQEREKELHRKLQRVKEEETAERQGRREAEEEVAKRGEEIEKWMTTATRYKKRVSGMMPFHRLRMCSRGFPPCGCLLFTVLRLRRQGCSVDCDTKSECSNKASAVAGLR